MSSYVPLIVIGLGSGSVFALAALGLVVTYKTSGVFNFAHGAVGAVGAYAFYELAILRSVPWPVAMLVAVLLVGAVLGLVLERLARLLMGADAAAKIVASVGLLLVIRGLSIVRYGAAPIAIQPFLPQATFEALGVVISVDQVILVVFSLVAGAALALFFQRTRTGVAMRAVVDNPDLVRTGGRDPDRIRQAAWMLGSAFAVLAGILIAPSIGLDATLLTLLVVQAFGGAALGRFESLPLAYLGSLAVGVLAAVSTRLVLDIGLPTLNGLPPSIPFLVLFGVLLASRASQVDLTAVRVEAPSPPLPSAVRRGGAAVTVALVLLAPILQPSRVPTFTNGLAYLVGFLALALLVRTSGQVSLAHGAFLATGAAAYGHMVVTWGLPWGAAVLMAALISVPVGLAVAIPAIRLSGLYLALATFGFGILMQQLVFPSYVMFGSTGAIEAPRPTFAQTDTQYYYLVAAVAAVVTAFVIVLRRARLGRLLRALADAPTALETGGTRTTVTKALVFAVSAFIAGLAGAMIGPINERVSSLSFDPFQSLILLAVLMLGGRDEIRASIIAAVLLMVAPAYIGGGGNVLDWLPIVFGTAAILMSVRPPERAPVRRTLGTARRSLRGRRAGPAHARVGEVPA